MHRIIANTVTYLVLQQETGKKEIVCRVVRFMATDSYLMGNPGKLFRLSLLSPGDYTGRILYYDIRGNLLDGGVYQDGEQIGVIRPPNGDDALTRGDVSEGRYYERFIVEWIGTSRGVGDNNWLDEVTIIGQKPYTPCYYTMGSGGGGAGGGGGSSGGGSGSSGGGSSGGGSSGGGGGSGSGNPSDPNTDPGIEIKLSASTVDIGENFRLTTIPTNLNGIQVKYKIAPLAYSEDPSYYDELGSMEYHLAKMPGEYVIQAVYVSNGTTTLSNKVRLSVVFPNINSILGMFEIHSAIDDAWTKTEADAGSTQCREHGFVAYMNTKSGSRVIDIDKKQSPYASYENDILIRFDCDVDHPQRGDFIEGGRYVIFLFHTHPPYFNATPASKTYRRFARVTPPIGSSSGDVSADIPAATKDYPGEWDEDEGAYLHTNTDKKTSPGIWPYGPERRTRFPI